ncbi:MAG TPA: hypothetical protein VFH33_00345, partial [Candidatus Krumholzibacteria bacterium]|nr:hypothetical protein [Candidatus Krumholzibacteria bacterium]
MRRRPGFAATAGLFMFGAMAAGFGGGLPGSLRAVTALFVVLVLPPFVLDRAFGLRMPGLGPFLRPLVLFLSWLCVLAAWTQAFTLARAPFHVYATTSMWLLLALFAACALLPVVRPREAAPFPPVPRLLLVAVVISALVAVMVPPRFSVGDDSLDHIGYVRHILSEDAVRPAGVLVIPVDAKAEDVHPDPRKGALHPVWAFVSALSATEPVVVWRWLGVLLFPAAVLALCVFNAAFLRSTSAAMVAGVLILLSFHGNPFRFAGSSVHGESLSALWGWTLSALVLCNARREVAWAWWMLLVAGGVLVHMGVTVHVLVLAATVACCGGAWGMARRERTHCALALAAGVVLAVGLRAGDLRGPVNVIHAHTQGVLFVAGPWFVASPMEILRRDGMLFLGGLALIPFLALAAPRRYDARAILAAAAIPFLLSFVPWVATPLFRHGSYMVFRSLLNIPVYAAIVVTALWLGDGVRHRRWSAWLIGVPAAVVWMVVFVRPVPRSLGTEVRAARLHTRSAVPVAPALRDAVAQLPAGAVFLSDPATSYALSAVTSARFVAVDGQHATPRDPFAVDRLRAVRDVLSPYVMPSEAVNACRRFRVAYVIVNTNPPPDASRFMPAWSRAQYPATLARMDAMAQSFALIDTVAGASIYRFETNAPVSWAWSAPDAPVRVASPALAPCRVSAPADEFETRGISVSPPSA